MPSKKTVILTTDESCSLDVESIAAGLNSICKHIRFSAMTEAIRLRCDSISNPSTYKVLEQDLLSLQEGHSCVIIGTEIPYDNNFFWDTPSDAAVIVSFYGWSVLTNLPKQNGMVGFVASVLAEAMCPDLERHDDNTGCVYDMLWDKRGIDTRLRGGAVCGACYARINEVVRARPSQRIRSFDCTLAEGLEDLTAILDEVSLASKREVDILDRWQTKAGVPEDFDVFLCHNSEDKPSVRRLFDQLRSQGVKAWFDEEHLRPGFPWQDELQKIIAQIRSVAVLVGANGQGPWQDVELRAFIAEFCRRACPVIPVLLWDAPSTPELPMFLRQFTWVDFRKRKPDPTGRLVWGITGKRPN